MWNDMSRKKRSPADAKIHRLRYLVKIITGLGEAKLDEIISTMEYEFGLRKVKVVEYLQMLETRGLIEITGETVKAVAGEKGA